MYYTHIQISSEELGTIGNGWGERLGEKTHQAEVNV
jgi:hypothetical protein